MKQTIEKLWNGHIQPCENCGEADPQILELVALIDRNRNDLSRSLNNQQKSSFEKYIGCSEEYCYLITAQAFQDGFSLACKLLSESLSDM